MLQQIGKHGTHYFRHSVEFKPLRAAMMPFTIARISEVEIIHSCRLENRLQTFGGIPPEEYREKRLTFAHTSRPITYIIDTSFIPTCHQSNELIHDRTKQQKSRQKVREAADRALINSTRLRAQRMLALDRLKEDFTGDGTV